MQVVDEVTGCKTVMQKRWQPGDGPHVPFSHMVVSDDGKVPGVCAGSAHAVGSLQECRMWQLQHGMRAHTEIQPW